MYCCVIFFFSHFSYYYFFFFFFSSRRRHTRCGRDWSSDVCSSDLVLADELLELRRLLGLDALAHAAADRVDERRVDLLRSEERRVGKECRSRWSAYH